MYCRHWLSKDVGWKEIDEQLCRIQRWKCFVRRRKENEKFKFRPSNIYQSTENNEIENEVGKLKYPIRVSVVQADVPLLLGSDFQTKLGIVLDIANKTIHIQKSGETFKMGPGNHWKLPIQSNKRLHTEAAHLVMYVDLESLSERKLKKHIDKTHRTLCHKSEKQMLKLFHMAGKDTTRIRNAIREVVECCAVCSKFKKTRPWPSGALAKANTPNEVVSLDLKDWRSESRHILYCCDEFSGYLVRKVIRNKKPDVVWKALDKKWILEGPGIPKNDILLWN